MDNVIEEAISKHKPEWNQPGMQEKYLAFLNTWRMHALETMEEFGLDYVILDSSKLKIHFCTVITLPTLDGGTVPPINMSSPAFATTL